MGAESEFVGAADEFVFVDGADDPDSFFVDEGDLVGAGDGFQDSERAGAHGESYQQRIEGVACRAAGTGRVGGGFEHRDEGDARVLR